MAVAGVGQSMFVVVLFLLAGLLVGGVWASYQNGSKAMTAVLALMAVMALAFALLTMVEVM
ncbi:hypothetical protein [Corynebacterium sp. Marseille-P4321]|uniref:hypothetical protein n=1 Tax=Corynebacterium sp. Marseille-P4321 TaxID=2736603 RepID=UPI0008940B07|nr:hypothetical protein [Corynebacterium sp. Marseille-P4321]OEX92865.1 hypothetical protein A0K93_10300 [Corynebacterium sp. BCW_4722]